MAFVAILITWFIAIKIVGRFTESVSALDLQAATGHVAVIVLLVIMNWFFTKFIGLAEFECIKPRTSDFLAIHRIYSFFAVHFISPY